MLLTMSAIYLAGCLFLAFVLVVFEDRDWRMWAVIPLWPLVLAATILDEITYRLEGQENRNERRETPPRQERRGVMNSKHTAAIETVRNGGRIVNQHSIHHDTKSHRCPGFNHTYRTLSCDGELDVVECSRCGHQAITKCDFAEREGGVMHDNRRLR